MTDYQTFISAINQLPPGLAKYWTEEILIRGTPEGGIAGAHVVLGVEATDPLGGTARFTKGPYALSPDTTDPDWQAVIGSVVTSQQADIAARDEAIAELTAIRDANAITISDRDFLIATLTAERDTLAARVAELEPAPVSQAEPE